MSCCGARHSEGEFRSGGTEHAGRGGGSGGGGVLGTSLWTRCKDNEIFPSVAMKELQPHEVAKRSVGQKGTRPIYAQ